jgi:hypothetical protein
MADRTPPMVLFSIMNFSGWRPRLCGAVSESAWQATYGQDFGNIIQYNYPGDDYKDLMAGGTS